jgi:hypothetical protein
MPDPLESSKRKLERAKEHFDDLKGKITEFINLEPYEQVVEPHPDKSGYTVHKIKLTQPLPAFIGDIAGDMVHNLRSALDNAGYAVAVAAAPPGAKEPKYTAFPFAGSVSELSNSIGGRCKDIPQQIQSLFCGFQPYPRGNEYLWALNELCNTDKHKIAIPVGQAAVAVERTSVSGTGFFSMPRPHIWDSTKNEMELITLGPDAQFNYELNFRLYVALGDIKVVGGKELLRTLDAMGSIVERILMAIEAEARRIKIFT